MRVFLAIYPSDEVLKYCRDVYRHFDKEKRNLKQVPLEQQHITLRFIGGKVSDNSKNMIVQRLQDMYGDLHKVEVKLTKTQFGFARQHDPRVLFADVEANPGMIALYETINKVIRRLDFKDTITWKSQKDRSFHLSIARFKPAATRSSGRDVKELLKTMDVPLPPPFIADRLHVVQSIIDSRGKPTYKILHEIRLS